MPDTKPQKKKKARITQKALSVLHPAEIRFIVIQAGIAEQLDAFRLDPSHWQRQLSGDKAAQQQFLGTNLDDPEVRVYVYGPAPAIREAAYLYIRALQAAVISGGPQPIFEEMAEKIGTVPTNAPVKEKDVRGIKRRTRGRTPKAPEVEEAQEVEEVEEEEVEEDAEEVEEEAEESPAGGAISLTTAVDEISKQLQTAVEEIREDAETMQGSIDELNKKLDAALALLWVAVDLEPEEFPQTADEFPSVAELAEALDETS